MYNENNIFQSNIIDNIECSCDDHHDDNNVCCGEIMEEETQEGRSQSVFAHHAGIDKSHQSEENVEDGIGNYADDSNYSADDDYYYHDVDHYLVYHQEDYSNRSVYCRRKLGNLSQVLESRK
jgi:ribosomal 30S subunit maturation factor RimM